MIHGQNEEGWQTVHSTAVYLMHRQLLGMAGMKSSGCGTLRRPPYGLSLFMYGCMGRADTLHFSPLPSKSAQSVVEVLVRRGIGVCLTMNMRGPTSCGPNRQPSANQRSSLAEGSHTSRLVTTKKLSLLHLTQGNTRIALVAPESSCSHKGGQTSMLVFADNSVIESQPRPLPRLTCYYSLFYPSNCATWLP